MRSVTAAFREAVQTSHTLATLATVGGETVPIIDGSVTLDSQAAIRGRCEVTLVDDGTLALVPDNPASLLSPYGNEITLSRGVAHPATTELVSLGVFGITDVEVNDTPGGLEIRVTGQDRASRFLDARFEEPYQVASGTNYATAILTVLQAAWPDVPYSFTATALTTPNLIAEEGGDRWAFAQAMAKSISMSLYFNGDGTLVLVPDVISAAVEELAEGSNGLLLTASRHWTRQGTFNRVIATGEATGEAAPVRGVATDDNPLSPTYYYGPFGKVPRFYSSPFLTTTAQANAAALTTLTKELGTSEQVQFGTLVLPYLEPGDTVRITRLRAGIDEDHLITSLTIPLSSAGSMSGQTRATLVT